jgi:hypothetical protein
MIKAVEISKLDLESESFLTKIDTVMKDLPPLTDEERTIIEQETRGQA